MEHWTKMSATNVQQTFCSFDIDEVMFYKFFSSGTLYNSTPLLNMKTKSKCTFTPFQNCLSRKTNARELLASSCLSEKIIKIAIVAPNK